MASAHLGDQLHHATVVLEPLTLREDLLLAEGVGMTKARKTGEWWNFMKSYERHMFLFFDGHPKNAINIIK
jgi:hypothetical protein